VVDDLAVLDGEDGRDRLHLERRRDPGVLVHVDLDELDRPVGGFHHLLEDGPEGAAGPHHGAHRSTTTGTVTDRSRTSCSKVASVTSITVVT
jgi:hypothetical protein